MPFVCQIYGLWLQSDQPLAGIPGPEVAPRVDVQLFLATAPAGSQELLDAEAEVLSVSPYRDESGVPSIVISTVSDGAYYRMQYHDGADFFIDKSGSSVWARRPDGLTPADISSYVTGPVLGFLLRLRGVPCLHASAINVRDRIVAFTGASGAGKTTLAAAFARIGVPVVCDDILALERRASGVWAKSGSPRLRLWSGSIDVLSMLPSDLPDLPMPPADRRHHLDLTRGGYRFAHEERPLAAVYFLQGRIEGTSAPRVEASAGQEALISLVGNSYAGSLLSGPVRAREFELFSEVAATVPMRRLYAHADPRHMAALCETVLADLEHLPAPSPLDVTSTL